MTTPNAILVTGVAGFLGRYIARHFYQQSWRVIGIDNSPPENAPLGYLSAYYRLRLPDPDLSKYLQQYAPQICVHCAGRASVSLSVTDPVADYYANTALTLEILNALRLDAPSCKFIFLSSAAVYGNPQSLPVSEDQIPNPVSPYGFHKWQGEQLCREFNKIYSLPTASVRIFSAYGPGLRRQVVWDICQKAIAQNNLTLQGTGKESRDFIHALDIAKAIDTVATSAPMQGEVYNLGTGREVAIASLAAMVLENLGCESTANFDGIVPVATPLNWQADITKLNYLGFTATVPLEQGIKTFTNWCRAELVGV